MNPSLLEIVSWIFGLAIIMSPYMWCFYLIDREREEDEARFNKYVKGVKR